MAQLGPDPRREQRGAKRSCGECSLCCTLLRVDALQKPAGEHCVHQQLGAGVTAGCGIHAKRPGICRDYACLWLQGGLEEDERPDRTGGVVDLEARGTGVQLRIQEIRGGAFDASPALQAIAARYREQMPVRICDSENTADPDHPFRVLLAGGAEQRVEGEWTEFFEDGESRGRQRLGWAERLARRVGLWRRRRAMARLRPSA